MSKPYQCRCWLLTIPAFHNFRDNIDHYGPLKFYHDVSGDMPPHVEVNKPLLDKLHITYICGQMEVAGDFKEPDQVYTHYQVFLRTQNAWTIGGIKREFLCDAIHCEPVTQDNGAAAYCLKDDETCMGMQFEHGTFRGIGKGTRNDIHEGVAYLQEHKLKKFMEMFPDLYVKYHHGFEKLNALYNPPLQRALPEIYWFYGPSGSGKSHKALELIGQKGWLSTTYFHTPEMGTWFDGYVDQQVIFFDDFSDVKEDKTGLSVDPYLRLISKTPIQRQKKGGMVPIQANIFIFTTEKTPNKFFEHDDKYSHWIGRFQRAKQANVLHLEKCHYELANLPDIDWNQDIIRN